MITKTDFNEDAYSYMYEKSLVNLDKYTMAAVLRSMMESTEYMSRLCSFGSDDCYTESAKEIDERLRMGSAVLCIFRGMLCLLGNIQPSAPNEIPIDTGETLEISEWVSRLAKRTGQAEKNVASWKTWAYRMVDEASEIYLPKYVDDELEGDDWIG